MTQSKSKQLQAFQNVKLSKNSAAKVKGGKDYIITEDLADG